MSEFQLIEKYFSNHANRQDVLEGPGDDCAILDVPANNSLVVSTDTLVSGVHFLPDMDPNALGYRALAVNLSDLAAMGADPRWVSLALTLPEVDEAWIKSFCDGFFELAEYYNVALIGGDMTRGPLSITVSVKGTIPEGKALLRSGAKAGDLIYVSGRLGDAALALEHLLGRRTLPSQQFDALKLKLEFPHPRILAGQALRGIASSALDISDGLLSDLGHITRASNVRAQIHLEQLPLSESMRALTEPEEAWRLALGGGDDYELCFTVPEAHRGSLDTALAHSGVRHTCIGRIVPGEPGVELYHDGHKIELEARGWDHFA
ncbi:thiamine-phosphate kinase [Dongshaea marina]|uniref:thiamine-phosphate kinase n=1 Tax=Dongshaea marina TaxID=2047966 RepID=UPI0018FFA3D7|nr:thiamine-phosphate kinase [Dongshaea marina]